MPTPVATARQCLTEEAARALDDAVAVAKRRNHAQTTSLHAVSALLAPSFSLLRESLSRSRSSAYSPRLQFRALELCVSVSLDRLPSSKSENDDFTPPISNSLMAAIKRSQANQRRQPDMYHLNQIHLNNSNNNNNSISISSIKVELKHFVLSILDDPIVSRVFGDAGFRSTDVKLAIIHPPLPSPSSRWSTPRCPPLFLCNLMDFPGFGVGGGGDENCRRIGEFMVKKREKNPVLVGVCAKDALSGFKECVEKGRFHGLPSEIHGLKLVCLETEIRDFLMNNNTNSNSNNGSEEGLDLKLKEVSLMVESCSSGPGVVINLGDLKVLVKDDDDCHGSVNQLVMKLSGLVKLYGNKLWLIGAAANYETYSNFVGKFPTIEKDWDLHPLPITSSRSSIGGLGSKSSLMGSFVPFGGFFPTPSDFRAPLNSLNQPFTRCNTCNEKYEQEVCVTLGEGSSATIADQCSASLPSWLQRTESDMAKGGDVVAKVKDVKTTTNEKISGLQKKWDDHCRHLHQSLAFPTPGVSLAMPQIPLTPGFPLISDKQGTNSSSSGDSSFSEGLCLNSCSSMHIVAQNISPRQQVVTVDFPEKRPLEMSEIRNLSLPMNHKPPSTVSVTTDLGLGTIYASKLELKKPFFNSKKSSEEIFREGLDPGDYKPLFRKLSEAVDWQVEAISRISEIVSCCRGGNNIRGNNIWLTFLGPDKVGKKRVALALADAIFGSKNRLISVDLSSHDRITEVNSLFHFQASHDFDINLSRKTVVDHIAQELCMKPHSVVFLENIDEADPLVQNSLSRAIQTGKFQDSRGREISINNVIFIATSSVIKGDKSLCPKKGFIKFSEEKILEAKNWEIQIAIRSISRNASSSKRKISEEHLELSKRANKNPRNSLDLNLPSEEAEEKDTDPWLEDFFGQVNGNVIFKPFDFDTLSDKLQRKIQSNFENTWRGERISLEIDHEVMVQILAAAWISDKKGQVEEWAEQVLGPGFAEARERYRVTGECVVRLVSCQGSPVKEWASGICLPKGVKLSI